MTDTSEMDAITERIAPVPAHHAAPRRERAPRFRAALRFLVCMFLAAGVACEALGIVFFFHLLRSGR